MSDRNTTGQLVFIDLLKAVAAQLILLHHLALYGPMADHARLLLPGLIDWLADDARLAVQVFLVIGGFLCARSLAPKGMVQSEAPMAAIGRRFLKLTPPFFVAMLLAAAASALAARWMTHDSIGSSVTLSQLAAHGLLLHSVLGIESLSAGAWYVAIDFQLYSVLILMAWLAHNRGAWVMPAVTATGVVASLFFFNRDAAWDAWAPYFFGSYGMGVLAWWACLSGRGRLWRWAWIAALVLVGGLALLVEFRSRIALALTMAVVLAVVSHATDGKFFGVARMPQRSGAAVAWLGRRSYALFLIHFPVCLVINAAFERFVPHSPSMQAFGMLAGWLASMVASAMFYRWVEVPLAGMFQLRSRASGIVSGTPPGGQGA